MWSGSGGELAGILDGLYLKTGPGFGPSWGLNGCRPWLAGVLSRVLRAWAWSLVSCGLLVPMIRVIVERSGEPPESHAFPTRRELVVGREEGVDLQLRTEDGASRQHCRIILDGERVFVEDLKSRHGTVIDNTQVVGRQEVRARERIGVGGVWLRIVVEPSAQEGSPVTPVAPVSSDAAERCVAEIAPRASRWDALDCPAELLLRGGALQRAIAWRDGGQSPPPNAQQRAYIQRSQSSLRGARRRWVLMGGLVLGTALGGVATSRALSRELELTPIARDPGASSSRCMEGDRLWAEDARKKSEGAADVELKLLLAAHAYDVAERAGCGHKVHAEAALRQLLAKQHGRVLGRHEGAVRHVAVALDEGARWVATSDGATVKLWDPQSKSPPPDISSGHTEIHAIALSPNGTRLAVAGDGDLEVWEIGGERSTLLRQMPGARAAAVAWSPDGRLLASAVGSTVRLWDLEDSAASAAPISGHKEEISQVGFLADGKYLFTFGGGAAIVWTLAKGKVSGPPIRLGGTARLTAFAASASHPRVVTGDEQGTSILWTGKARRWSGVAQTNKHKGSVVAVALEPGTDRVISVGEDSDMLRHEMVGGLATGRRLVDTPTTVMVDPSGQRVVTSSDGAVRAWDLALFEDSAPLIEAPVPGAVMALASRGQWLVTGGADHSVRVWDIQSQATGGALILGDHGKRVRELVASQSGKTFASWGDDKTLRVWQMDATGLPSRRVILPVDDAQALALMSEGRWLAAGGADHKVTLWNLDDGSTPVPVGVSLSGHGSEVSHIVFSSDDRWLVSADSSGVVLVREMARSGPEKPVRVSLGNQYISALAVSKTTVAASTGDKNMHVWGLPKQEIQSIKREGQVVSLGFSADGVRLAAGDDNYQAQIWGIRANSPVVADELFRSPLRHDNDVTAVAFSAASFATGSRDGAIRVWRLDKQAEPQILKGHEEIVTRLAFTQGGETLVSASDDRTLKLWRFDETGRAEDVAITLSGHADKISRMVVPASSTVAISASFDGTIRVWPLLRERVVAMACGAVGRNLTAEEWDGSFPGDRNRNRKICPER